MKVFNGIVGVLLGFLALYLMFINAENDNDIILGFIVLLCSIIFFLFMFIEEGKEEIDRLRNIILGED